MTVSSLVPVNNYTGNSYSKKFDFDFLIEKESELKVYLINSSGYSILLENGIDYSINEIGNPNGSYITFPLSSSKYDVLNSDEKLSLALDLVIKQENEFKNSLYFNFDVLEWTFDYIIRILQIFSRRFERAVLVTEGAGVTPAELLNNIEESESAAKTYSEISKAYSISSESYSEVSKNHSDVAKSHSDTAKQEAEKAKAQAEIAEQKARETGTVTFLPVSFLYGNECAEEFPCYAEWVSDGRELNSDDYSAFVEKYLNSKTFSVCNYEDYQEEIEKNDYCKKFAINPFIYNRSQFTVVGSPVIDDDGIASEFSGSNYLKTNLIALKNNWIVKIKVNFTNITDMLSPLLYYSGYNRIILETNGTIVIFASEDNITAKSLNFSNVVIEANKNYLLTISYDGVSEYKLVAENLDDKTTVESVKQLASKFPEDPINWFIGSDCSRYIRGNVDLSAFLIIVNDLKNTNANTFKLPRYKHTDEFLQKANLDLNNLSDTGKKVIDGQWVIASQTLSTTTALGTYTIDLSDYLPEDNYSYEVMINARSYTDASTPRTYISVINNDMENTKMTLLWGGNYARQNANTIIIVVDATRMMTIEHSDKQWTSFAIDIVGYRRIGTNS